jgi:hypothetical protein
MKYRAVLYDKEKAKTISVHDDWKSGNTEGLEFMWTEGNFACDCNRALLIAREQGLPDPDRPCGNTRYILLGLYTEDGLFLHAEPLL